MACLVEPKSTGPIEVGVPTTGIIVPNMGMDALGWSARHPPNSRAANGASSFKTHSRPRRKASSGGTSRGTSNSRCSIRPARNGLWPASAPNGNRLFNQLFAHPDLYAAFKQHPSDQIRIAISGAPEFHRLHWETLWAPKEPNPLAY